MSGLQERAEELTPEIESPVDVLKGEKSDLELEEGVEELMDKIERREQGHRLMLDDPSLYLRFALLCYSEGRFKDAENWIKKALRLEKSYIGFLVSGKILQRQSDNKGALGEYDSALDFEESALVHRYRYQALKERDMVDRATEALDRALEQEEDPELIANKADLMMEKGEPSQAKELYEKAEELDPDLENKKKKIDELLKDAEKTVIPEKYDLILEVDEEEVDAWIAKAECYMRLNQPKKARRVLKKGLEIKDDHKIIEKLKELKTETDRKSRIECPVCGGSGECRECDGTGDCEECQGSGNCSVCNGTSDCPDCYGLGECPECEGKGKGLLFECKNCSGTGHCQTCGGYGTCYQCGGISDCQDCGGNGNCGECQGSGNCVNCGGEGTVKKD